MMAATVSFSIARWSAWAPGLDSRSAWSAWSQAERKASSDPDNAPSCAERSLVAASSDGAPFVRNDTAGVREFPPLLVRRASRSARAGLRAALDCMQGLNEPLATVFASRHGEVHRSIGLLEALARGEPLSPTAFGLSVHNAPAGIFSIARADRSASTSMAAGRDSLPMAVLEACGVLAEGAPRVLVVVHDEPVPAPFQPLVDESAPHAGAALLLEPAGPEAFSLDYSSPDDSSPELELNAADGHLFRLLRFLLDEQMTETEINHSTRSWRWRRRS
jgi:beta-ketoacyl synthase-like protein